MTKTIRSAVLAGSTVLAITFGATGAFAATTSANASATIVAPVTITQNTALNFGTIAPDATNPGTVAINALGAQTCATVSCLGGGAAGAFTLAGLPAATVSISTAASTSLTGPGAAMSVNGLAPSAASATLGGTGAATFTVTGTLTVNANQLPGSYTGTYNVTANYN